jgi:hypothetical protein
MAGVMRLRREIRVDKLTRSHSERYPKGPLRWSGPERVRRTETKYSPMGIDVVNLAALYVEPDLGRPVRGSS